MRLLGFAFVLAFFSLFDHVVSLAYQHQRLYVCSHHQDCALAIGPNCFCVKPPHLARGECLCKLDPDIYRNDCSFDGECSSKGWGSEGCYCAKEPNQAIGKCKCDNLPPLLG